MPNPAAPDFRALLAYRTLVNECIQAPLTRDSYRQSWSRFEKWCGRAHRCPFPASAETVIFYIVDSLTHGGKIESARLYVSAINHTHKVAHIPVPDPLEVRGFLASAQRLRQERPAQKTALRVEDLRQICHVLIESGKPLDIRNRAVLLLAFSSALRRSNVVALDLADLHWQQRGLVLAIRKSKTDQMAEGELIAVVQGDHPETDAIAAVRQWLQLRGDKPGPLFRKLTYPYSRLKPAAVASILKGCIAGIGLTPLDYAGHSLRSGFVTAALSNGANELAVLRTTKHRSLDMLNRYLRECDPFKATASSMIGL